MPTIIAICPYCRAGGVRASDSAIGASANCPKCKSSFTVMPEDDLPEWAAKAKPDATSFSAPSPEKSKPKSSPLEETSSAASMADVTEPSPVLPAEPKPKAAAAPQPALPRVAPVPAAAESSEAPEPAAPPPDMSLVFALVALVLVGPAMLISQVPYGRAIALVVVVIGFVAGLLSLGGEGRAKSVGGLAMGLHVFAAIFLLFLPSWLGLDDWRGTPEEEPKKPVIREHGTGMALPLVEGGWVEASNSSWEFADLRITMRSALGPVELHGPKDAKRMTKEPYLQLTVQVANIGADRAIPLSGWAAGQGAEGVRVVDSGGRTLTPATFEAGWAPERGRPATQAMPSHASEVVMVFTAPPAKTEFVRVQLPGAAVGVQDEIKFRAGATPTFPRVPGK